MSRPAPARPIAASGDGSPLRALAPAKVNLGLAVVGRRQDGFHDLESILLRIGLADELEVRPGAGPADALVVQGDPDCLVEGNLVLRAAAIVRARLAGPTAPPLAFRLRKRIPVAAGLGGGSSDAAAALRLLEQALGFAPEWHERWADAEALGSDVPFFVSGAAAAHVAGRGERAEPLPAPPSLGLVLVTPHRPLATAEVFARFDRLPPSSPEARGVVRELADALAGGLDGAGLAALAPRLRQANDLWPAAIALRPELAGLREAVEAALGRLCLLSGSGPTLVALYPSGDEAAAVAPGLAAGLPHARIIATDLETPEPLWRQP
ncbi:MAG TPA: 4-(cytidine 5'-diphospho)-2-C-methyl-D-erythritol kinase [Candidatus Limnocylindrales bacterium]|nr:4-(cytidine 5'-diphospho)-2-C-methyl-D-erythritol kinase [Candidatus Limnocylindrales bacterium]